MTRSKKIILAILKWLGLGIVGSGLIISLLPTLFPEFVTRKINDWTASHLTSKLAFSHATLSFFDHFPALTLSLHNVRLNGSAPFQQDTLVAAQTIALGVDLSSLLEKKLVIDKVFLADARINVQVDKQGQANYNVYASSPDSTATQPQDSSGAALTIENITIERTNIVYNDQSIPMLIRAKGLFYEGKGDLSKEIFDLYTHTHIDSVDLYYANQPYVLGKQVNADLITKINTHSLAFLFTKNDLKINQLPVAFTGKFAFVREGYTMDFKARSVETDLHNIVSALPPDLVKWATKTDIHGFGSFAVSLAGNYVAATNTKPALQVDVKLRDGSIAYEKAPSPLKNLRLDLSARLPNLDPEQLDLAMDTLHFTLDNDFWSSRLHLKGVSKPTIHAFVNTDINLEKWDKALGIPNIDLKGHYRMQLRADGDYRTGTRRVGLHKTEPVITSIPTFSVTAALENGYVKYGSLPEPIRDIQLVMNANCPDHDYQHAQLTLDRFVARALTNTLEGYARVQNAKDLTIDARLKGLMHLAEIKSFYPLSDSIKLAGDLTIDAQTQGQYLPDRHRFPVTNAAIRLTNGSVQTPYYPHPVERIQVDANVLSRTPSLKTLTVVLKPVSFWFEGKPFQVQANLRNFDNLTYALSSKGVLDVGRLYQVFAQDGYDVKGIVHTNLSLQGTQADAMAGRYDKLLNRGTMQVENLTLTSDLFPKPFLVKTGLFRFEQDKVWFDQFKAQYGSSAVEMNGYLNNVIDYATKPRAPLRGSFTLTSDAINIDEFMVYASKPATRSTASQPSGVVLVPDNLAIDVKATARRVSYDGLKLQQVQGQMTIDSGQIKLQQTGFTLIGTPVAMEATYRSLSPKRAWFNYHINAKEFDIKRAYKEVAMFRELASSAAKAEGIISLDYQIQGDLDANMDPVLPSLKGGGVLSVKKVKMNGFRLFNAVSAKTGHNIQNPDVSEVDIKTTIDHNTITLERTKLRVAGFRPRLEGQVGLNGRLNLKFRLGLPPLGIIGIPMTITGTQTKPKVRLGKKSDEEPEENSQ